MKRLILLNILLTISFSSITAQEVDFKRRSFINQFLETYKSAYANMDIGYIEDVFSEDALIITEGQIKRIKDNTKTGNGIKALDKNSYSRVIESKHEYIKRIRLVFKDNIALRLSVANTKVYRHKDWDDIYGLCFLQHWKAAENSSLSLEDDYPGYIFMMLDFKSGDDCPTVHVRTWQPETNIKKDSDIYNLYDFLIL